MYMKKIITRDLLDAGDVCYESKPLLFQSISHLSALKKLLFASAAPGPAKLG